MAPRTYARRFQQETGTTPHQWMLGQRILRAQHLLEDTTLTVDAVAAHSGFGNDAALRHHFLRRLGTTPNPTAAPSAARNSRPRTKPTAH